MQIIVIGIGIGVVLLLIALWAFLGGALGLYGWTKADDNCDYGFFSVGESRTACNGSLNADKYQEQMTAAEEVKQKTGGNRHYCVRVNLDDGRITTLCLPAIITEGTHQSGPLTGEKIQIIPHLDPGSSGTGHYATLDNSYASKEQCQEHLYNGDGSCIDNTTYLIDDLTAWYPGYQWGWWNYHTVYCPPWLPLSMCGQWWPRQRWRRPWRGHGRGSRGRGRGRGRGGGGPGRGGRGGGPGRGGRGPGRGGRGPGRGGRGPGRGGRGPGRGRGGGQDLHPDGGDGGGYPADPYPSAGAVGAAGARVPAKTPAKVPAKTPAKVPAKTPAKVPAKTPAKVGKVPVRDLDGVGKPVSRMGGIGARMGGGRMGGGRIGGARMGGGRIGGARMGGARMGGARMGGGRIGGAKMGGGRIGGARMGGGRIEWEVLEWEVLEWEVLEWEVVDAAKMNELILIRLC